MLEVLLNIEKPAGILLKQRFMVENPQRLCVVSKSNKRRLKVEQPTKDELVKECQGIDQVIMGRLSAKPEPVEKDNLLTIREALQKHINNLLLL